MKEQFENLISLSDNAIFIKMGLELIESLGAREFDEDDLSNEGKSWFRKKSIDFKTKICKDSNIKKVIVSDDLEKDLELFSIITELLKPELTSYPLVLLAGIMIVKKGLLNFCLGYE
jgi:hypothetical protein